MNSSIKILFVCVFLFEFLFVIINGDVGYELNATHPDHPGKCWSKQLKKAYNIGESFVINCREYSCDSDLGLSYRGCGKVSIDVPGCYVREIDNTKPYPKCCPEPVCN